MSEQPATDPHERAKELLDAGNSFGMISKVLGIPKTTIYNWLKGLPGNVRGKQAPKPQQAAPIAVTAQPVAPSTHVTTPPPRTYTRRARRKPHATAATGWQMAGTPVNQITNSPSTAMVPYQADPIDTGYDESDYPYPGSLNQMITWNFTGNERPQDRSILGTMADAMKEVVETAPRMMIGGWKDRMLESMRQMFYPPNLMQQQSTSAQSIKNRTDDVLTRLGDFANQQEESRKQQEEFKEKDQEKTREEDREQRNEFYGKFLDVISKWGTQDKKDSQELSHTNPTLARTDGQSDESTAATVAPGTESIAKDVVTATPQQSEDSSKSATGAVFQPPQFPPPPPGNKMTDPGTSSPAGASSTPPPGGTQGKSTTPQGDGTIRQDMTGPGQQQQKPSDSVGNENVADHLASVSLNNQNGQQNVSDQQDAGIALAQSRGVQAPPTQPILPINKESPGSYTDNNSAGPPDYIFAKCDPARDQKGQGDNTNSQPGWWDENGAFLCFAGSLAFAIGVAFLKRPEKTQQQSKPSSNNSGYARVNDPNGAAVF